jgi:hypothetical protein
MQFFQFQTLLNCVTNDFLQHGNIPHGLLPPFPPPMTSGDPSTLRVESSLLNLSFALKLESRLLNMSQFLLCYRVLRVASDP